MARTFGIVYGLIYLVIGLLASAMSGIAPVVLLIAPVVTGAATLLIYLAESNDWWDDDFLCLCLTVFLISGTVSLHVSAPITWPGQYCSVQRTGQSYAKSPEFNVKKLRWESEDGYRFLSDSETCMQDPVAYMERGEKGIHKFLFYSAPPITAASFVLALTLIATRKKKKTESNYSEREKPESDILGELLDECEGIIEECTLSGKRPPKSLYTRVVKVDKMLGNNANFTKPRFDRMNRIAKIAGSHVDQVYADNPELLNTRRSQLEDILGEHLD